MNNNNNMSALELENATLKKQNDALKEEVIHWIRSYDALREKYYELGGKESDRIAFEVELNGKKRAMTYSQEDAETMMKYHGIDMKAEVFKFMMEDLKKETKP